MVRHEKRFCQVERQSQHHAPVKSRVTVCEWEDGGMEIHYRGQKLKSKEIEKRSLPERLGEEGSPRKAPSPTTRKKWRPGPDHPWRRGYGEGNFARLALPRPSGAAPSLASAPASP